MKTYLIAFFGALVPMLILDGIWLSLTIRKFYGKYVGDLMASTPSLVPAALFYPLYIIGLLVFVILPSLKGEIGLGKVFLYGGLFGLVAYGTYDLTNQATLRNWSAIVTVVDMAWGACITGLASLIAVHVTRLWS